MLTISVFYRHLNIAELLLKSGANINYKHAIYHLPIFNASSKKMVELLVRNGANVNSVNALGKTALFYALSPEVVKALLDAGAKRDLKSKRGETALSISQFNLSNAKKNIGIFGKTGVDTYQQIVNTLQSYAPMAKWLRYAKNGELVKLKVAMKKGVVLKEIDYEGNTALHLAAEYSHDAVVSYLISKKLSLKAENKKGQTALDLVRAKKNSTAKLLSCVQNKYCRSVASFEKQLAKACSEKSSIKRCLQVAKKDIHGVFMPDKISERTSDYAFNNACKKFSYKKCQQFTKQYANSSKVSEAKQLIAAFTQKGKVLFDKSCGFKGSAKNCKRFIANHPGLVEENKVANAFLYLNQKCRLKESGWIYKSSQCRSGLAHGTGEAVNQAKKLSFKGRFVNGQRVKGEILYGGQPMFDGTLLNGRPNGVGICFYKNEPEECKFYKGKRVDAIYKQRLANIEQQEKMDAKLAEMKQIQKQQSDQISQIKGQVNAAGQHSAGQSVGQQIGDYAMRKAGEKVMDKLFDKLF